MYLVQGILIELDRPVSQAYVWNESLFNGLHHQRHTLVATRQPDDHMTLICTVNSLPSPISQLPGGAALSDRAFRWECQAE